VIDDIADVQGMRIRRVLELLKERGLLHDRKPGEPVKDGLTLQWYGGDRLLAIVRVQANGVRARLAIYANDALELEVVNVPGDADDAMEDRA
jgi:hypothetical protein